uniref:Uncharacterized protein n=1 Tax=Amphimedon queenslandica TaxID=400682 RepID=A0A1X7TBI8_AMPQE
RGSSFLGSSLCLIQHYWRYWDKLQTHTLYRSFSWSSSFLTKRVRNDYMHLSVVDECIEFNRITPIFITILMSLCFV